MREAIITFLAGRTGLIALGGLAYCLAYLWFFAARPDGERGARFLSDLGEVPLQLLTIALAVLVAVRDPRRAARVAWLLAAVALAADMGGNIAYGVLDLAGREPFPSVADGLYLAFYPLMFVGLLAFPTAHDGGDRFAWRTLSNVLIVMLGGGMALIHFVLLPTLSDSDLDPIAMTISLAYPAADMALVAAIATLSARRPYGGDRPTLALFIVAVTYWLLADLLFAIGSAGGSFSPGGIADLTWLAGDLAFLAAAQVRLSWVARADGDSPTEPLAFARLGPIAMLALGLVTLVAAAAAAGAEVELLAYMAGALTILVVIRQTVDERQRRRAEAALAAEQAGAAERAARQARHDALTGLPNRRAFREMLEAEFAASRLTGHRLTLVFLDLNYFKAINDSLGHAAGDGLLVAVARRLQAGLRDGDTVARLGGDEFAILLPATSEHGAIELAARLRVELERPFDLAGHEIAVGGSFGLATYPDSGAASPDELVHQADAAMYRAKRGRLGPTAYDQRFEERGPGVSDLADLRAAIAGDELLLAYAPLLSNASGRTEGVEALVRWNHPRRGLLDAAEFVPLARGMGLLAAMELRGLDMAAGQAKQWRAAGFRIRVAVNISSTTLFEPGFADEIRACLARHRLPGEALWIEITEDSIAERDTEVRRSMRALERLGVRSIVDGFGTGSASLAVLRNLPVSGLKIDRSFFGRNALLRGNTAIIEAIVGLAHRLDLTVIADGVDDRATIRRLAKLGVDYVEGASVGLPATADETTVRLRNERIGSAQRMLGYPAPGARRSQLDLRRTT